MVLERQPYAGAVGRHLAVLDLHVLLHDLGHAQVFDRAGCGFHGHLGSCFPGFGARTHQFDDLVDTVRHAFPSDPIVQDTRFYPPNTPRNRAGLLPSHHETLGSTGVTAEVRAPSPPASARAHHATARCLAVARRLAGPLVRRARREAQWRSRRALRTSGPASLRATAR